MLNVNDYFQVAMRSGKMHSECGGPAPTALNVMPGSGIHRRVQYLANSVLGIIGVPEDRFTIWPALRISQ